MLAITPRRNAGLLHQPAPAGRSSIFFSSTAPAPPPERDDRVDWTLTTPPGPSPLDSHSRLSNLAAPSGAPGSVRRERDPSSPKRVYAYLTPRRSREMEADHAYCRFTTKEATTDPLQSPPV